MKKIAFVILMALTIPVLGFGQSKTGHKKQKSKAAHKTVAHKTAKATETPRLVAPATKYDASSDIYFPKYYTYYDAGRGGYVSGDSSDARFTPAAQPFLQKVNMGKMRLRLFKGLSLDLHPELNFPHYIKQYPADPHDNVMVAAPIPGNPVGN